MAGACLVGPRSSPPIPRRATCSSPNHHGFTMRTQWSYLTLKAFLSTSKTSHMSNSRNYRRSKHEHQATATKPTNAERARREGWKREARSNLSQAGSATPSATSAKEVRGPGRRAWWSYSESGPRRASTIRNRCDASMTISCASRASFIRTVLCECGFLYEPMAPANRLASASRSPSCCC